MTNRETFEAFVRLRHPTLMLSRTETGVGYQSEIVQAMWVMWKQSRAEAFDDIRHCAQVQGVDSQQRAEHLIAQVQAKG